MKKNNYKKLIKENKELSEWKRKLSLILKYSSEIKVTNNLKDVLNTITRIINEILQAERSTVFLIDEEKSELYSWAAQGLGFHRLQAGRRWDQTVA